ncbi:protein translocase SEC61 complex subunit gamma [Archaeoglobus neptunius]|uniref:protein translocase SEC61 complex subunit gamma n=1 Tax=Archaeoglobus neptunius TaxID=2798580 RepID=UPI0019279601|nr:protein translocase SEC61 complex subunit gamma [Archaeoglobus neptunius]
MQSSEIQNKLREYYNVLKMARKPDWEEFSTTAKVAIVVMIIVGFIGFAIYILMEILPGALK